MNKLEFLTPAEIESIHQSSLRVLAEVGIHFKHSQGVEVLEGAGAKVNGERVLIPPEIVEDAVSQCCSEVTLHGREGGSVTIGNGELRWHNLGGARDVYEHSTSSRRPAALRDVIESTRVLDSLDNVDTIVPLFTPQDVPGHIMELAMYRHAVPNTTKPLHGPCVQNGKEVLYAVRMAEIIGDPVEVLNLSISPISPLTFPDDIVQAFITAARQNIPIIPLPCPTAGTTAPMSIAGCLVQQNAEILASVTLIQLLQPGLPVTYAGRSGMMEPRTAVSTWSGVELGMISAASVQLGHRYNLPVNVYGFSTNSLLPDLQTGFQHSMNAIIPALAGADELSGVGELESGVLSSLSQLVIDNEMIASVNRILRGFSTDENALAIDLIAEVVRGRQTFTAEQHTVDFLRSGELLYSSMLEHRTWADWDADGRQGLCDRAQNEVERILAEHQVAPLLPEQETELDLLMEKAVIDLA
ncbi:MAG: trimethylamine methyltransferase family protein [Anaerolineales bacterium]|nr:trimethylamine methyltransferase family protein [Anaerolineales bacterium]